MLPEAASEAARQTDSALTLLLIVSAVILTGVTFTMIAFATRFHRSRVTKTRQIHSNLALELTWTIVPTIIVIGLFFIGYEGFATNRAIPAADDSIVVEVTGQQWFWSFHYPEYELNTTEMTIPVDRDVVLHLTSLIDDVVHSFFIPAFRIKEDAVPGTKTRMWMRADRQGDYNVFCAEYCGTDHARMRSLIHVVSEDEFESWVQSSLEEQYRAVDISKALTPDAEVLEGVDGPALFGTYCASCHQADGTGGGPYEARNLTDLDNWREDWVNGPRLSDIFRTISKGLPDTNMRPFGHLPVMNRLGLMHVVAGFGDSAARPETTEADLAALKEEFPELDPSAEQREIRLTPVIPVREAMERLAAPPAEGPP